MPSLPPDSTPSSKSKAPPSSSPQITKRSIKKSLKNQQLPPKKRSKIDRINLILSLLSLLLFLLILLSFNQKIRQFFFPQWSLRSSELDTGPVIERVLLSNPPPPPLDETNIKTPPLAATKEEASSREEKIQNTRLFFIRVNEDGLISLKSILRSIPSNTSPLTTTVQSLLEGPRPVELSRNLLSLLPEDSRLLAARIEDKIAWLDFNEAFRFNALGIEGYRAQIKQVVFTATEFSTVEKVQFLIEGQRLNYLGGEGFWIGNPLGREDF